MLDTMIARGSWTDVGAVVKFRGGENNTLTCRPGGGKKATRRDYAFANLTMLPCITGFKVDTQDQFATHKPIIVTAKLGNLKQTKRIYRKPQSYKKAMETKIERSKEEELREHGEDGEKESKIEER